MNNSSLPRDGHCGTNVISRSGSRTDMFADLKGKNSWYRKQHLFQLPCFTCALNKKKKGNSVQPTNRLHTPDRTGD